MALPPQTRPTKPGFVKTSCCWLGFSRLSPHRFFLRLSHAPPPPIYGGFSKALTPLNRITKPEEPSRKKSFRHSHIDMSAFYRKCIPRTPFALHAYLSTSCSACSISALISPKSYKAAPNSISRADSSSACLRRVSPGVQH
jgi:hypothetical protein